jgi:hypothetical protein
MNWSSKKAVPSGDSLIETIGIGLINVPILALPQLIWLAATALFHLSWRVCDAALVAADIVLLACGVTVMYQTEPAGGMWWIVYFPIAIVASILTGLVARVSAPKRLTNRCSQRPHLFE